MSIYSYKVTINGQIPLDKKIPFEAFIENASKGGVKLSFQPILKEIAETEEAVFIAPSMLGDWLVSVGELASASARVFNDAGKTSLALMF